MCFSISKVLKMAVQRHQQRPQEKFPFLKYHLGCASSFRSTEILLFFIHERSLLSSSAHSTLELFCFLCIQRSQQYCFLGYFWEKSAVAGCQTSYCLSCCVAGIEDSYPLPLTEVWIEISRSHSLEEDLHKTLFMDIMCPWTCWFIRAAYLAKDVFRSTSFVATLGKILKCFSESTPPGNHLPGYSHLMNSLQKACRVKTQGRGAVPDTLGKVPKARSSFTNLFAWNDCEHRNISAQSPGLLLLTCWKQSHAIGNSVSKFSFYCKAYARNCLDLCCSNGSLHQGLKAHQTQSVSILPSPLSLPTSLLCFP